MADDQSKLSVRSLRHFDVLWASLFGVGFLKPAPGTWGTLAAALVWWFLLSHLAVWVQVSAAVLYFLLSWWLSHRICVRYNVKDAPQIVADEVVGMWLALIWVPKFWWWVLIAVALFRLLDILKPSLIGVLDREVDGGLGVMMPLTREKGDFLTLALGR